MKIKLRRKARRIKLAASVGALSPEGGTFGGGTGGISAGRGLGSDDGITTGWICVNVGEVPGHGEGEDETHADALQAADQGEEERNVEAEVRPPNDSIDLRADADLSTPSPAAPQHQYTPMASPALRSRAQERPERDEPEYENPSSSTTTVPPTSEFTIAGFGHESTRPRIVVQLFTEEKRAEMDLEGLWENRLARLNKAMERDGDGIDSYAEEDGFGPVRAAEVGRGEAGEDGADGEVRVRPFEGDEDMERGFVDIESIKEEGEGEGEGIRATRQ